MANEWKFLLRFKTRKKITIYRLDVDYTYSISKYHKLTTHDSYEQTQRDSSAFSLGATKKEIKNTFFYLGMIIGGGGIIAGVILGLFSIYILGSFDIISLPADVYGTSKLPLDLSLVDFMLILVGSIFIVLFSSYYPSYKATKINVLDTLRNE